MSDTLVGAPPTASRAIPAAATQPRPFRLVRHSLALAKRSLIKTWRTPEALIDVTLQPVLFLVIFVYIFGGAVAGSTHDYLQFLLPGILAQTIATGAIAIGVNLNTDIAKGIFDRFRSLPIPRSAPLVGAVLGDVVRYVIVTVSTLAIGYLLGFRIETDPLRAIAGCLLAVLFALCLSWLPVFVSMKVRTPGAVQGLMFALIMPLSFASNVFVDAGTLPGWMQAFVRVNPMTHLVESVRGLFLGTPVGAHVWWTLLWCAGFVAVFMPLALRAYRRKI
ncbi:ABC transporter permease [Micromonospora sp. NPDC050397]|uniref:ABC transporter permease n=1 Tax=Micromonospora sp. NPDC050397 TaxID=3364279 RepID=UPI00384F2EBC